MPYKSKTYDTPIPHAHSRRGVRLIIGRKDIEHFIDITVKMKED